MPCISKGDPKKQDVNSQVKRLITENLLKWRDEKRRKPLVLRGARQVGKTWAVTDFGRNHMEGSLHVVNLERRPDWHRVFEGNFVATRVLSELEILLNARITPGRDLLFFDEIQSCPGAITMLRYFYEEMPDLHVIAAGSLIEFALRDVSLPVGRVQFLTMYPMTLAEFLMARGLDSAAEIVTGVPVAQPEAIHQMLLAETRNYMFVGGMPECVSVYCESGKLRDAFEVQSELVDAFRQDFSKYAPHSDKNCLNAVFSSIARNVGRQIKYTSLAESCSIPTVKKDFELLRRAQLVHRVPSASAAGLPLGVSAHAHRFKALMVDIGLMQHLCGMPAEREIGRRNILDIHEGSLAEQFVGQELVAGGQEELYYWSREAKSSSAEVDFLVVRGGSIHPVEVKSGSAGKLRSLLLFMKTYPQCPHGYVLSGAGLSEDHVHRLRFLPLYFAYSLARRQP